MHHYHYAVVVGINHYPGVSDLVAPVSDALDFHTWLVDPAGGQVPPDNVELITTENDKASVTDPYEAEPILRQVIQALQAVNDKVRAAVGDDIDRHEASRLYVFVAGHGYMPRGGETAFLFADARENVYEHIELSACRSWYEMCGLFHEVVVFADCCRNWLSGLRSAAMPLVEPPRPSRRVFTLSGYAAAPDSPAYEENEQEKTAPDERRGYFTRALISGLRGACEDPNYGAVTSATLGPYVKLAVRNATKGKAFPQEARMPGDNAHPIVFGKSTESFAVTILFPPGWTDQVELIQGSKRTQHVPGPSPWELPLRAGLYQVVLPGTYDGSPFVGNGMFRILGGSCVIQL